MVCHQAKKLRGLPCSIEPWPPGFSEASLTEGEACCSAVVLVVPWGAERQKVGMIARHRRGRQNRTMEALFEELLLKEAEIPSELPKIRRSASLIGGGLVGLMALGAGAGLPAYLSARRSEGDPKLRAADGLPPSKKAAAAYLLEKEAMTPRQDFLIRLAYGTGGGLAAAGLGAGGAMLGARKGKRPADRRLAEEILQNRNKEALFEELLLKEAGRSRSGP